jgi:hypothetical protein
MQLKRIEKWGSSRRYIAANGNKMIAHVINVHFLVEIARVSMNIFAVIFLKAITLKNL